MKLKKILKKLETHLDTNKVAKNKGKIKKLLKKLKHEQRALKKKLNKTKKSSKAAIIKREIDIVKSQRQKGLDALKGLKESKKKKEKSGSVESAVDSSAAVQSTIRIIPDRERQPEASNTEEIADAEKSEKKAGDDSEENKTS